jgi:hypothetical protein
MLKIARDFIFKPQLFLPTRKVPHFNSLTSMAEEGVVEMVITDKDDTITLYR